MPHGADRLGHLKHVYDDDDDDDDPGCHGEEVVRRIRVLTGWVEV